MGLDWGDPRTPLGYAPAATGVASGRLRLGRCCDRPCYDAELDVQCSAAVTVSRVHTVGLHHSQRIGLYKYLDTRRPIAPAADHVASGHAGKSQSQVGGLPELLLASTP